MLLGAGSTPRRKPSLLLPGYDIIVGRCEVPGCGAVFHEGEEAAWQAHVGPCARRNLDRIHSVMKGRHLPAFDDFDPEVSEHLRRVGERMLREGRMEVKPNEAAGHS